MDDLEDFLEQMEEAVGAGEALFEVPMGWLGFGEPAVRHGPWPAATCAAVLRVWLDAGWLELVREPFPPEWDISPAEWEDRLVDGCRLTRADAADLLDHPERWGLWNADGHATLAKTGAGAAVGCDRWYAAVRATAERLPLRPGPASGESL